MELDLLLPIVAAFIVGLSKGGLANVGSAAVPLLALSMPPVAAAAMLLPIYVFSDIVGVWIYHRKYSRRNLSILVPAGIAGVLLGWALAASISDTTAGLLVGAIGCAFCLNQWWNSKSERAPRSADVPRGIVWGTLTGLTSTLTHSGAATFQIYVVPQRLDKLVFAGTSTILFAVINASKILPYWQLNQLGRIDLRCLAVLVPVAFVGTFVGAKLARSLPSEIFFKFVRVGLFLVSLKLIFDALTKILGV